jgi:hypothetical protein
MRNNKRPIIVTIVIASGHIFNNAHTVSPKIHMRHAQYACVSVKLVNGAQFGGTGASIKPTALPNAIKPQDIYWMVASSQ